MVSNGPNLLEQIPSLAEKWGRKSDFWYEARTPNSFFDPAQGGMNWEHFLGEVNQRGRAVGGHVVNSRIVEIGSRIPVGDQGLFKVMPIEINGVAKAGGSTFFPESWTDKRVKYEVFQAFNNKVIPDPVNNPRFWVGVSPGGVEMQGYLTPHLTVYPFQ